ncbi:MAG: aldehyde dehydrogenase family protein [Eubacterium pyruvativorans]|uniref:aldehyde dehydrogenase family protein n=1 Tax=Eubacterium pyruvativorans TaxID=155865 RepID=UPI002A815231|nr:aldehyde dehydrogenase family protein [Eubacterium pyruvativorans]MDY4049187.1 aldehyde dehydrogenase family protein [Eubacterium pyruvativorans]
MKKYKMIIGGKNNNAICPDTFPITNPSTGDVFCEVEKARPADVDKAVVTARNAFNSWHTSNPCQRALILERTGNLIEEHAELFIDTITEEIGMPIKYCREWQVDNSISEAHYYAKIVKQYPFEKHTPNGVIRREPYGVTALMTPWNYPLDQITLKAFPAIAAGNTVIVKPSRKAPLSALILAKLMKKAGLPDGVFNVVTGLGNELGDYLATHPDIRCFSFTGSTQVGLRIGGLSTSSNAKHTILEMGGKSAILLLRSGDAKKAVKEAATSVFINSGQTCCAFTRLLIPKEKKEEIENYLVQIINSYKVGNPKNPTTDIGPVVSKQAYDKINAYITSARDEQMTIITSENEIPERGWYIKPTAIIGASAEMKIAKEEIFGPVLTVILYETEEEALQIANSLEYGLDGAVFGEQAEAEQIARKMQAGNVHVNGAPYNISMPFGGYKQSGIGREGGIEGFEEYLETKSIFI